MEKIRDWLNRILGRVFGVAPGRKNPRELPILCDTCKNNYGNVCFRPERPNATECPDYRTMGGTGGK